MQKSNQKFIIISNWKANPSRPKEATKIFDSLKKIKINTKKIFPIICTSNIFFEIVSKKYKGSVFNFGAQNISIDENTEQTGEVLAESLKEYNIKYSIIGHSERRAIGETNEIVSKKIHNALKNKITPIVCIGENERDTHGEFLLFLERQVKETFANLTAHEISKIIIAYEPVWAVGTGSNAISSHDLNQTVLYIKKILVEMFDRKTGLAANIIYGGSVDDENISEVLVQGDVNGVLIGRASVNPSVYAKIIKKVNEI